MPVLDPLRDPFAGPELQAVLSYAERRHEEDMAEARQEALDWVDAWLAQRVGVSDTLRDSLWRAGMDHFELIAPYVYPPGSPPPGGM